MYAVPTPAANPRTPHIGAESCARFVKPMRKNINYISGLVTMLLLQAYVHVSAEAPLQAYEGAVSVHLHRRRCIHRQARLLLPRVRGLPGAKRRAWCPTLPATQPLLARDPSSFCRHGRGVDACLLRQRFLRPTWQRTILGKGFSGACSRRRMQPER